MTTVHYTARINQNGSLDIPKETQEELGIKPGDPIRVMLTTEETQAPELPPVAEGESLADFLGDFIGCVEGSGANNSENTKDFLNPAELPNWSEAFSQIVVVPSGSMRTIFISGQVAVDARKNVVGRGDLAVQADYAFANLAAALRAADAKPEDVVRLGIYVKDYRSEQAGVICAALRKLFVSDRLPASTWLGVQSLALDDLLIEIEATAVVEHETE